MIKKMKEKQPTMINPLESGINELEPYTNGTDYNFYFGPAHPGSGNFGVKLVIEGEKVVSARADPGYLHRGFEKLMEYRTPIPVSYTHLRAHET